MEHLRGPRAELQESIVELNLMTSQINFDDFNRAIIIRFLILLERKIRYLNNRLDIMEIVEINRVMNSENFNSKLLHVLTDLILRFTGLRRQLIAFKT